MDDAKLFIFIVIALLIFGLFSGFFDENISFIDTFKDSTVSFVDSPIWDTIFFAWKIVAGIASIGFLIGIIGVLSKTSKFRFNIKTKVPDFSTAGKATKRDKVAKKVWEAMKIKAKEATEESASLFVVEADTIVDEALIKIGVVGDTMGERLKALRGQKINLDELWEVHKIRNQIAHTPGYRIKLGDLNNILNKYERVLKDLDVI